MTKCPHCGGFVAKSLKVTYAEEAGLLTHENKTIKLMVKTQGKLMLACILSCHPRVATHDFIITSIWEYDEPDTPKKNISIIVHKLNKQLKFINLRIRSVFSIGYVLEELLQNDS